MNFWTNVSLALFGSAVLSFLTSLLTYFHEKRKTLEGFVYHTKQIVHFLNQYQESMSLEEKIKFFLAYNDFDKTAWDADYGNMDFFWRNKSGNRKYIFDSLYQPIIKFNSAVNNHSWHFKWHLDGSGRNENVMAKFVDELESYLIVKKEYEVPVEYNDDGSVKRVCKIQSVQSLLVRTILKELNGHYFEIMYGKKVKKQMEANNNGQA